MKIIKLEDRNKGIKHKYIKKKRENNACTYLLFNTEVKNCKTKFKNVWKSKKLKQNKAKCLKQSNSTDRSSLFMLGFMRKNSKYVKMIKNNYKNKWLYTHCLIRKYMNEIVKANFKNPEKVKS